MSESHQQLLLSLKTIVEGLLSSQVANVWNIYGGLTRLHRVLQRVLKHEFTVFKQNGEEDCWALIARLGEVQPSTLSGLQYSDPAMAWLQQCLESHTLSGKLFEMISDEECLATFYTERAFLRQPLYAEAALTCLKAVELNQLSLLTDIHPSLFLTMRNMKPVEERLHRRCSSYPESVKTAEAVTLPRPLSHTKRTWNSLPCLTQHVRVSYSTQPSSPVLPRKPLSASLLKIDYSKPSSKQLVQAVSSIDSTPCKRSFLEDGPVVLPMSTGFFPRPSRGQSLASFLTSSLFSHTSAELDRENAHFSISEAIIAAIEQVKYNRWEKLVERSVEESDEEKDEVKQRIRLRRRQKQEKPFRQQPSSPESKTEATDLSLSPLSETSSTWSSDSPSTEGVDDMEVDQVSPTLASSAELSLSMASLYSEADLKPNSRILSAYTEINDSTPAFTSPDDQRKKVEEKPEVEKKLVEIKSDDRREEYMSVCKEEVSVTAEGVALSLLKRFSDKQLPRASDIDWLVSEKDAPQQLLPLPESWLVDEVVEPIALRGTSQWAPPRPQIIFTIHPPTPRRTVMVKQKYMCAGCGVKVAPEYAHRFRYCDYLGRYFCTGCHSNQVALIPARILFKWDFNKYPVSNFSFKLLDQMSGDPLFNVDDINPSLYKKVRALGKVKNLRLQLFHVKDFLFTCRFSTDLKEKLEKLERETCYLLKDTEVYSINDLSAVRSGQLSTRLSLLMSQATGHIAKCQLCEARGFICEVCNSSSVIFPWQLGKVVRCARCGSCFHQGCHKADQQCPRCLRITFRLTNS